MDLALDIETHRFPCNTCGADLRYAPGTDHLECDHCGAQEPIDGASFWRGSALKELNFDEAVAGDLPESEIEETRVLDCVNCGAQVEFDAATHAAECPFCATPVVTGTGTHRHIKPRGLLPFGLSENTAQQAMADWLGQLWFAPTGLRQYARKGRRLTGIYVPYWTYDATTRSRYSGERGTVYYETKRVQVRGSDGRTSTQTRQVPRVRWRHVTGRVSRIFDDILVLASRSLPKKYTDALGPWDLAGLEPYRPEFLAGFRAEGYTVQLEDGFDEASARMQAMIVRDVKFDIGGDRQKIHDLDTDISNLTFKHILLPVWMAAYKYRGRTYRFVINGRTGAVQGERPYSWVKIALAVIAGALVAGAVGFIIAQNQGAGLNTNW